MNEAYYTYRNFLGGFLQFKPSSYSWIFVQPYSPEELDKMADEGNLRLMDKVIPDAILWCAIWSVLRVVITYILLEPLAMSAMNFKLYSSAEIAEAKPKGRALYEMHNKEVKKRTVKFVEASWRAILYATFLYVGFRAILKDGGSGEFEFMDFIWDTKLMWKNWPFHPVGKFLDILYTMELGAYLHQLLWTEVVRDDAVEMIVHHITTILLIGLSALNALWYVGGVIMVLHDIADIFLETAKCFNYAFKNGRRKWASPVCDALFAAFAISFAVTRLGYFPYIIRSVMYDHIEFYSWPSKPMFLGLLITLQILHVYWFYLIMRMVVKMFTTGIEKDERSDDEGEEKLIREKKD